jgi:UDP-N-acetylmuramate dehydrogenase
MLIQEHIQLAPYTSFGVGGPAEQFALIDSSEALLTVLKQTTSNTTVHIIGYGSNSLISDKGLNGLTICIRGGTVQVKETEIIADAGAWWDDVVTQAISHELWGIECLSEVPGSVGAGLYINIAAYGQSIGERVKWIEVWDRTLSKVVRLEKDRLTWGYKKSMFQEAHNKQLIITRACFELSRTPTHTLTYQKALDVAEEYAYDIHTLTGRRATIIETRARAGSLWHPDDETNHTVGSFFRNPIVTKEQADRVMAYDETGKTASEIKRMNKVHGGDELRVSAAHVMLASGFVRGQSWGNVKLNDKNVLKIEALYGATAQEIYQVAKHIQRTCKEVTGIELIPEARILGEF